jgi:hypothetical protein
MVALIEGAKFWGRACDTESNYYYAIAGHHAQKHQAQITIDAPRATRSSKLMKSF